ncbi:MAG TPA: hypothetical protein DCF71_19095, partial [Gemmatimonadetes bacterium]|nr:hypothetical protein [Gemmatimonadota bacterium]
SARAAGPGSRRLIPQLEFQACDTGYGADDGAETLLNRSETGGCAATSALLTGDRAGEGH